MNYQFFGDIVIVEQETTNVKSSILEIPEIHRKEMKAIKAKVIAIGKLIKPRKNYLRDRKKRQCTNTTFGCDYLKVGDIILVPEELGTRGSVPFNDKAIIYDTEDVLALVEDESLDFNMKVLTSPASTTLLRG